MPKKRDRSPDEFYRGRLRELEKENKALRKQVKQLSKKEHMFDDTLAENQELLADQEIVEIKKMASCPECIEGQLQLIMEMDKKDIFSCNSCSFRKVINK